MIRWRLASVCASSVFAFCLVLAQEPATATQQSAPYGSGATDVPQINPDGAALFHERGCVQCHGANLEGTGKGPSLQSAGLSFTHEKVQSQIADGGKQMPPFGGTLSDPELQSLVDFVMSQKNPLKKSRKRASH